MTIQPNLGSRSDFITWLAMQVAANHEFCKSFRSTGCPIAEYLQSLNFETFKQVSVGCSATFYFREQPLDVEDTWLSVPKLPFWMLRTIRAFDTLYDGPAKRAGARAAALLLDDLQKGLGGDEELEDERRGEAYEPDQS